MGDRPGGTDSRLSRARAAGTAATPAPRNLQPPP